MSNYQVVFSSLQGSGSNNNSKIYNFDWTSIPESRYEVTFTFCADSTTSSLNVVNACIYVDIGITQSYEASLLPNNISSSMLGTLNIINNFSTTSRNFMVETSFNPPTIIQKRPNNNKVQVDICTFDAIKTLYPSSLGVIPAYVLTLNFRKLD